ncbi:MAG: hypothetical protein ACQESC_00605 [Nanobdellota archaeon]
MNYNQNGQNQGQQTMPPPPGSPQNKNNTQGQEMPGADQVSNEELIEAIIDEKWRELEKDIQKIIDWKNNTEKRITTMEEKVTSIKQDFDKLHENILGKVGSYDEHIQNVHSELKAMEQVFAKVLPVFTEKVNELSNISDTMKSTLDSKNSE